MGYIRAFLLIATSFAMGAATAISLTIVSPSLPVLLATLGWILVAALGLTNRNASCKDLSDIGSGSGKTERSK